MTTTTVHTVRPAWGDPLSTRLPRVDRRRARAKRRTMAPWIAPLAWALTLACLIALIGALPTARDLGPTRTAAAIPVKVGAADTLWSIARSHPVPGATTAETVEAIIAANHLSTASVREGDVLSIPYAGADAGTAFAQVSGAPTTD